MTSPRSTSPILLLGLGTLLLGGLCGPGPDPIRQIADPIYVPTVADPVHVGSPALPIVRVDETHNNFGGISDLLGPTKRLLEVDGYVVEPFSSPFDASCEQDLFTCNFWLGLTTTSILVMPNPRLAISQAEADAIALWVAAFGGSLFLIIDHNVDAQTDLLLERLLLESIPGGASTLFTGDGEDGLIDSSHPIALGRNASETIDAVRSYGSDRDLQLLAAWDAVLTSAAGGVQGVAAQFLVGRYYVSTEGAMFTAEALESTPCTAPGGGLSQTPGCIAWVQDSCDFLGVDVIECQAYMDYPDAGIAPFVGMNRQISGIEEGEQFVLNVMHWLDGTL